jgi:hypothetical protein
LNVAAEKHGIKVTLKVGTAKDEDAEAAHIAAEENAAAE